MGRACGSDAVTDARGVGARLRELANGRRLAMPAASCSFVRAFNSTLNGRRRSSLTELASLFDTEERRCSVSALRTIGVPDELLALACTEIDPIGAGSEFCDCGGGCAVDVGFLEDPDNRPYIWDQEAECR